MERESFTASVEETEDGVELVIPEGVVDEIQGVSEGEEVTVEFVRSHE